MHSKKHESLGRWISILYRYRDIYFEQELTSYSIGPSQLRILLALHSGLHRDNEMTQTDIARLLRLDKGAMTKSIRKLEQKGYIKRRRSTEDCREYRIILTDKAHEKSHELRKIRRSWGKALGRGFMKKEKDQVLGFLQRMAENAELFLHQTNN